MNEKVRTGGQEFSKTLTMFIGMALDNRFAYNLNGKYTNLQAVVGLADGYNTKDVDLKILGDNNELWSGTLKAGELLQNINIDTSGVLKVEFQFETEAYGVKPVVANAIVR